MIVGVVPAAGHATRLGELPCSKEVLPVRGRPVLDYLVEKMAVVADEIRVVTRPDKADVAARARELGAAVVEGRPPSVADSVLLGMDGLATGDTVLMGFSDTLWEPRDGFARLTERLDGETDVALGVFTCPDLTRSDVVTVGGGRVTEIHVKPAEPPSALVWGCLAARAGALEPMRGHSEPGAYLGRLARAGRVAAVVFGTEFVDIGMPDRLEAVGG